MDYLKGILDDWLTRAAAFVFLLIIGLVVFNHLSDLPEQHPLFGVFLFLMVPILFVAGGIVFVLAIWRLSR